MPTNYNFRNTPNYWDLTLPNVAPGGPKLQTYINLQGGWKNNLGISTGTAVIDYTQRSPLGNFPVKFTTTGTGRALTPINVTNVKIYINTIFSASPNYFAKLWYKTDSSANNVSFGLGLSGGGGGGGGLLNIAANTWFNLYGDAAGSGNLEQASFYIDITSSAIGQNYWFDVEYIKRQSRTGIAPNFVYTDLDPTTTTSFDDQFIPADTFRQGNLLGWGANNYSAQGFFTSPIGIPNDLTNYKSSPLPVGTYSKWKSLANQSSMGTQMYAIDSEGYLWFWGLDNFSPISWPRDPSTGNRATWSTPTFQASTGKWSKVARYGTTINGGGVAIKTNGTLWTWGLNDFGQLGNNTIIDSETLVQEFTSSSNWKNVAAGTQHICAIKTDGTLWCWGNNDRGQLGDNTNTPRSIPVQEATSSTNWKEVGCGHLLTASIKSDGSMWLWGDQGPIGGSGLATATGLRASSPTREHTSSLNWKTLNCGGNGSSFAFGRAVKTDGTAWSWAYSNFASSFLTMTQYANTVNKTWAKVYPGNDGNEYLIASDTSLWGFGNNTYGDLGLNDNIARTTPVPIQNLTNVKSVMINNFVGNVVHVIRYIDPII